MARAGTPVRYRRSACLVAYWDAGGLRVHNFATATDHYVDADEFTLLNAYSQWAAPADVMKRVRGRQAAVADATDRLAADGFLVRSDRPAPTVERQMRQWRSWNPAAGFFHSASRNQRFRSFEAAQAELQGKGRGASWPGARFAPPRAQVVALPRPRSATPVARAFLRRRSWRQFGDGRLQRQQLSNLLWLTGGVQHWAETRAGDFALKTSPSGGALHPIELYVLVRGVQGLPAGFYHYSGAQHVLRRLRRHTRSVPVETYLPEQPWFEGAAAIVFLVAHYERYLWKYDYARAYRGPFVEAGHLAQTFCVAAADAGLAPFVSMALDDSAIEQDIGADGVMRAVLYAVGVGMRPRGMDSAPAPEGVRPSAIRKNRIKSRG